MSIGIGFLSKEWVHARIQEFSSEGVQLSKAGGGGGGGGGEKTEGVMVVLSFRRGIGYIDFPDN